MVQADQTAWARYSQARMVLVLGRGVHVIPGMSADIIQHLKIWRGDRLFMNAWYESR